MDTLLEILSYEHSYEELETELLTLEEQYEDYKNRFESGVALGLLNEKEGSDNLQQEALSLFMEMQKRFEAAKRALGLVNKLKDSPSRTRNRSRIMSNLNKIRGSLQRLDKILKEMD